jgi:AcrR family transcriptional regulator
MKDRENAVRAPHTDNRRQELLDVAAAAFRCDGYTGSSLRKIAASGGMQPGSVYYHFPSKESLLVAVYEEGVRRISESVRQAIEPHRDPWRRLEAACIAHLEVLLDGGDYSQVVIRILPPPSFAELDQLVRLREQYEMIFRELVAALPLAPDVDAGYLRLLLLGALNWTQVWYRPGRASPEKIATSFLQLIKDQITPKSADGARDRATGGVP